MTEAARQGRDRERRQFDVVKRTFIVTNVKQKENLKGLENVHEDHGCMKQDKQRKPQMETSPYNKQTLH